MPKVETKTVAWGFWVAFGFFLFMIIAGIARMIWSKVRGGRGGGMES